MPCYITMCISLGIPFGGVSSNLTGVVFCPFLVFFSGLLTNYYSVSYYYYLAVKLACYHRTFFRKLLGSFIYNKFVNYLPPRHFGGVVNAMPCYILIGLA